MLRSKKHIDKKAGFAHILLLLVVLFVGLVVFGATVSTEQKKTSYSSADSKVLGESETAKRPLTPCSSAGLTTSTKKVFQEMYPNETFLQLTNIDLFKDVNQLKDLTCLQYLDATDRTIKGDIGVLKNLVNLEVFSLYSNPEVSGDICTLAGATNLRSLKFAFDPKITGDISCLKDLAKLETFAMTHTQISGDISVLANMPNLKAVYVSGTNVKGDICSLAKLTNLEELGIADEYPGNPDITGDLSCLDNLQKLKRVSIYNTSTTNCEQFTKSHPDMDKTKSASGKQGGGGCSKESMKTLVDYAQKYEKKIGKEVQTEVRGKPNYNKGGSDSFSPKSETRSENRSPVAKFVELVKGIFGRLPFIGGIISQSQGLKNPLENGSGPGGCTSQAECQTYCSNPDNQEECQKFAPPDGPGGPGGDMGPAPDLTKGGPGGCKSQTECQAYCSKKENFEECSQFAPPGQGR